MQPDILNSGSLAPYTTAQLKEIFRSGWSQPVRVEGWVKSGLNSEFWDDECRAAWKAALVRAADGVPPGPVLDLGTGPGTISLMWAELGYATTGVDFSPAMLEMARSLAGEHGLGVKFMEGDAERLPFKEEQFTIVSARFLLFTLPNPGYALRSWAGLLEPGGALVIIGHEFDTAREKPPEPSQQDTRVGWRPNEEYRRALSQLPFMDHKRGHVQVLMEAAGLRDIVSLPIEDLLEARERYTERLEEGAIRSTPYILVGRKADA